MRCRKQYLITGIYSESSDGLLRLALHSNALPGNLISKAQLIPSLLCSMLASLTFSLPLKIPYRQDLLQTWGLVGQEA
jgi:hypothetical protein